MVYNAFAGGGGEELSPLSLITGIQELQTAKAAQEKAAQDEARQRAALPALAAQMGIPIEQVTAMFDQGALDDVLIDQAKPKTPPGTKLITDPATGKQMLVNENTGDTVREFDTGLSPTDASAGVKRRVIEDKATGRQWLVDDVTGDIVQEYTTALNPTTDQQQYNIARQQGYAGTFEQWLTDEANRKKQPPVQINNNLGPTPDRALVEGADTALKDRGEAARGALGTIEALRTAQQVLQQPGGIIAGSMFSPAEYETRKAFADLFGITDPAVVNSATYSSTLGDVVLKKVKQLGTGNSISNADREFTEKNIGASNQIPAEAMPRILAINEFGSRNEIIKYNADVERRLNASKDANGQVDARVAASLEKIPVPKVSDAWMQFVNPKAIEILQQELSAGGLTKETKDEFDALYGPNAAEAVIERLTNG